MSLRLFLVVVTGCGSPTSTPPDAARAHDATTHPDAANCALSSDVTGTLGSYAFGPIASAHYQPRIDQGEAGIAESFTISDGFAGLSLSYVGNFPPTWSLTSDGHDTYPPYLPFNAPITAVKEAGCWTVTFHLTFNQCDGNGGNCVTPIGGFDGTVHVGN